MTLVDDLFDCLVFELDGVFRWLHLLFSISVLTSYLSTGLGEYQLATISVALLNDLLTEGAETLMVTVGGAKASIVVNDTSIKLVGTIESNTGGDTGGDSGGVG